MPQAHVLAYLMLAIWPLVSWQLWHRLDHGRALIWTILGGYLLLPPLLRIDLPGVPDLDKVSIPNLAAAFFALFVLRDRISFLPQSGLGRLMMALFVLSPFATVLTNTDPLIAGPMTMGGMRIYDSFAAMANQALVLLPYFLARRYLARPGSPQDMLVALVAAGLAYSVPMLVEIRLSPQLNVWIYGFFQHDFSQMMRMGGYRPIVFLPHGLWLAFFAFMAAMAGVVLARSNPRGMRLRPGLSAAYLLMMLILCKSAGPAVYTLACLPLVLLAPARVQIRVAALLALIVMLYPILRGAGLIPVEAIIDLARGISADRAGSFAFRIDNENRLLAHAAQRPWFGWGGYGRNLLYDPHSGNNLTIADGYWIIVLGIYGWVGYLAEFGLMVLPLLLLAREVAGRAAPALPLAIGTLALIHTVNLVDLLPNATSIPFTWLMAGTLLGQAERLRAERLRAERLAARRPGPLGAGAMARHRRETGGVMP